jgi:hypothetical protein
MNPGASFAHSEVHLTSEMSNSAQALHPSRLNPQYLTRSRQPRPFPRNIGVRTTSVTRLYCLS